MLLMANATEIKLSLINWLLNKYQEDIILGNEVAYSPIIRRADLVMLHNNHSYAFEIKSDCDTTKRLNEQLNDYMKAFDFVFVVTTKLLFKEIKLSIPKNVGIIVVENKVIQKRKAIQIKRLNKRFLAEFLDRKILLQQLKKDKKSFSVYDLRDDICKQLTTKQLRILAIESISSKYIYQSKLLKYDVIHSGITIEDVKTLTGGHLSHIH